MCRPLRAWRLQTLYDRSLPQSLPTVLPLVVSHPLTNKRKKQATAPDGAKRSGICAFLRTFAILRYKQAPRVSASYFNENPMSMHSFRLVLCAAICGLVLGACNDSPKAAAGASIKQTMLTFAETEPVMNTVEDSLSYHVGFLRADELKNSTFDINVENYLLGMVHAMKDGAEPLTQEQVEKLFKTLEEREFARMRQKQREMADDARAAGVKFLAENAKKDSVEVLPSGLQYIVRKRGSGKSPEGKNVVRMHYRMMDITGKELNSSYKLNAPQQFRLDGLQPGLREGLPMMREGGRRVFFLPSNLALDTMGRGPVSPGSVLIYEVDLVKVQDDFETMLKK